MTYCFQGIYFADVWLQRLPDIKMKQPVNEATMAKLSKAIGKNWWSLMHDLGVAVWMHKRYNVISMITSKTHTFAIGG